MLKLETSKDVLFVSIRFSIVLVKNILSNEICPPGFGKQLLHVSFKWQENWWWTVKHFYHLSRCKATFYQHFRHINDWKFSIIQSVFLFSHWNLIKLKENLCFPKKNTCILPVMAQKQFHPTTSSLSFQRVKWMDAEALNRVGLMQPDVQGKILSGKKRSSFVAAENIER